MGTTRHLSHHQEHCKSSRFHTSIKVDTYIPPYSILHRVGSETSAGLGDDGETAPLPLFTHDNEAPNLKRQRLKRQQDSPFSPTSRAERLDLPPSPSNMSSTSHMPRHRFKTTDRMNPRPESARESRPRNRRRFTLFPDKLDSPNFVPLEGRWPSNRPSTVSALNASSPLSSPFAHGRNLKRTCEEKKSHQLNQRKKKRRTFENISECEEATGRDHDSGYGENSLIDKVSPLTTHHSFNDRPSPGFTQRPSAKGALVRPEPDDIEEGEVVEEEDDNDARMLARMKDSNFQEQKPERKWSVIVSNLEPGTTPEDVATVFSVFGKIIKASALSEQSPERLGGGFMHEDGDGVEIIFESVDAAHLAQSRMNGMLADGRKLSVVLFEDCSMKALYQ